MKVFNLQCEHGHGFEGWFGSEEDFRSQTDRGLLACPVCETNVIHRLPSAPRLSLGAAAHPPGSGTGDEAKGAQCWASTPEHRKVEELWMRAVRHVLDNTEDVGSRFAEEARRIHYGEVEQRSIRGQSSPDEMRELHDEGVEVFSLPIPNGLKGPVQ